VTRDRNPLDALLTSFRPALAGLTVIDAGQLIAGPMIGMILGDFGADVIKIEHPKGGDPLRTFGKMRGTAPLYWRFLSRNKRSVNLALNSAPGQDLFRRLISETQPDVMIESFRPGTLERWGLGYEHLRELDPGLILVRVSGFGQTGPYRERPGFGTLAEAMSGFAHMTGEADGPPTLPPIPLADSVAALYGTIGALLALRVRDGSADGRGQVVDASLLESLFTLLGNQLVEFDQLGVVAQRNGNRAPTSAPRNLYPTADGSWVAIAAPTRNVVERLFRLIDRPELIDDVRFVSNEARLSHVEALDEIVVAWTSGRTRDDALRALVGAEVPAAPVADMADLADDPHLVERGAVTAVDDPELGRVRMPGIAPRLSQSPGSIRRSAPEQGSANDEIYRGRLGLTAAELASLRDSGVI
jgi:crotonobetainyl-CoA:carnitine CoA-transferase CaiB-like acyl-CoA transferase